jgi:hypothetical protein
MNEAIRNQAGAILTISMGATVNGKHVRDYYCYELSALRALGEKAPLELWEMVKILEEIVARKVSKELMTKPLPQGSVAPDKQNQLWH